MNKPKGYCINRGAGLTTAGGVGGGYKLWISLRVTVLGTITINCLRVKY